MSQLPINGVELFYDLKGSSGSTVALLNGVAMSNESWAAQVQCLSAGHQVLLHDFRGQGRSTLATHGISFEQHADDLRGLLDHLSLEKVHVVGVSYGAEVGMYFALMYPERISSLTLGTAVSESDALLKAMIEAWVLAAETHNGYLFFKVMAPAVYSRAFYETHGEWLEERAVAFGRAVPPGWFDAFVALCRNFLCLDITGRLPRISAPTLVVSGGEDILKPPHYGELIHARIQGSRFEVIPGAGHGLFLEKAEAFNQLVGAFIDSL